ncbi:MAG: tetratricopeptide repeat protein [Bacteroidales bacterium]|nr:tetratricopeptide repeat protein [Bacteroidales bacterium]
MKIQRILAFLAALSLAICASAQNSERIVDAVTLLQAGHASKAASILESLASANPADDAVWFYLGRAESALGRTDDAVKHITKASELDPKNYWYRSALAALYQRSGETDMVINLYESILRDFPDKTSVSYDLLPLYIKQNRFEDALNALQDVESIVGPTEQLALTRYEILGQMGKTDEAVESLRRFNEEYSSPAILSTLGDYYSSEYEDSLSLKCYDEALSLQGDYTPALVGASEIYFRKRAYPEFFSMAGRFMRDPASPTRSKSLYLANIVRRTDPKVIKRHQSEFDELVESALQTHPSDSTLLSTAGTYYYSTSREERAGDYFSKASELYPESLSLASSYIQYLWARGEWNKMKEVSKEVFNRSRELAFLDYLTVADYQLKDYDAIIGNNLWLTKNSTDPAVLKRAWSSMGDAYHEKGDEKEAFRAYDKALKIDPQYAPVLNNYAYYLCLKGKKLKKAASMSAITVKAEPDNPTYLDTYAWILHLQGKDSEAKPYLKHAMLHGGKESVVLLDHYAEILYALGEYDLAVSYWMEARAKNKDGEIPDLDERVEKRKAAIGR